MITKWKREREAIAQEFTQMAEALENGGGCSNDGAGSSPQAGEAWKVAGRFAYNEWLQKLVAIEFRKIATLAEHMDTPEQVKRYQEFVEECFPNHLAYLLGFFLGVKNS
jgi:hypothetical protein